MITKVLSSLLLFFKILYKLYTVATEHILLELTQSSINGKF